jgi:hypothetical protein
MGSARARWMVVFVVVVFASALAACTRSTSHSASKPRTPVPAASSRSAPPSPVTPTGRRCRDEYLDLALPSESVLTGVSSPVKAAKRFVALGGTPGYGSPTSVWRVTDQGARAASLTDGVVHLEAIQLRDKTWVIIGGSRCR